jgi:hypothetical protein
MSDIPQSFEFAKEVTTQLLTLATGVVSVSVTFTKDISSRTTNDSRRTLYRSWICFLASICFGVWVLCAMTGTLAHGDPTPAAIYEANIKVPSLLQIGSFVFGIFFLIRHATASQPVR